MQVEIQADRGQINTVKRNPRWIVRTCEETRIHFAVEWPPEDGWAVVHAFLMQGWQAVREGDCVRVFWADAQEGTA